MTTISLPTDHQIESLHRKYARSEQDFNLIYTHCQIVEAIAMQLIDNRTLPIDRQLVHVGCMLHDLGVYPLMDREGRITKGVTHGIIGEELLKSEGFPEVIWRLASHHTGVGLTKEDVVNQGLPIPIADYTAVTDEERMVMYADKFHTKNRPPTDPPHFCTFEWYKSSVRQFGEDKIIKFEALADLFGKPDIEPLSERFNQPIVSADVNAV